MTVEVNESFKPDPSMKTYYRVYVGFILLIPLFITVILLLFFPREQAVLGTGLTWLGFLPPSIFILYWISKFYSSISFKLTEDRVIVKKGVWFKKSQNVPYRLIMNVTVEQGPIYRFFGLGKDKIETAGHSGQRSLPEAEIFCVQNYEEIKETILNQVKKRETGPYTTATEESEEGLQPEILKELKKIRKSLEKS